MPQISAEWRKFASIGLPGRPHFHEVRTRVPVRSRCSLVDTFTSVQVRASGLYGFAAVRGWKASHFLAMRPENAVFLPPPRAKP